MNPKTILDKLRVESLQAGTCLGKGEWITESNSLRLVSYSPSTGQELGAVTLAGAESYEKVLERTCQAFEQWRIVPAPKRGQLVRDLGDRIREFSVPLGELVSLEMGKIRGEGIGEVQEMIDICDFAVGLSRQLCGSTMHSERPGHRMYEQYHPLGPIGIFSAFNFPVAVWSWNAALAAICGDSMIWKPSLHTPLCAVAVQQICNDVASDYGIPGLFQLLIGPNDTIAQRLLQDPRLPLISFTGSTEIGRKVAQVVAQRLGRSLLELGGNNAMIIEEDAELDLAVRAILFGAVGTAGQRCTSTRRLLIHHSIHESLVGRLMKAYQQIAIGDPLDPGTLMGPLVNEQAIEGYFSAIDQAQKEGGKLIIGGNRLDREGFFVEPTIILMPEQSEIVMKETFAPILYVMSYQDLDEAIRIQNGVAHGLSSSLFTTNLRSAELFLSSQGSDCGIANINIGTSGAEIGGAFGGEKDTGGGRESGSDAWKIYMRRQTNTINYSRSLPLSQGITFGE